MGDRIMGLCSFYLQADQLLALKTKLHLVLFKILGTRFNPQLWLQKFFFFFFFEISGTPYFIFGLIKV
jgi:hypothetical protein